MKLLPALHGANGAGQSSLRDAIAPLRTYWRGLAKREQRMLLAGGLAVALVTTWWVLVEPALKSIAYWQEELPRLRSQATALDGVLKERQVAVAAPAMPDAIRRSLDASGLAGHYELASSRGQAGSPMAWELKFSQAPAGALVGWLLAEPPRLAAALAEVELARAGTSNNDGQGAVLSGRVRLGMAPAGESR
jgi:general secretion pathway protein M